MTSINNRYSNKKKVQPPPHRSSRRSSSSAYKINSKEYSLERFVLKSCQFLHRRVSSPMMNVFEGSSGSRNTNLHRLPYPNEVVDDGLINDAFLSSSNHNATFSSSVSFSRPTKSSSGISSARPHQRHDGGITAMLRNIGLSNQELQTAIRSSSTPHVATLAMDHTQEGQLSRQVDCPSSDEEETFSYHQPYSTSASSFPMIHWNEIESTTTTTEAPDAEFATNSGGTGNPSTNDRGATTTTTNCIHQRLARRTRIRSKLNLILSLPSLEMAIPPTNSNDYDDSKKTNL